MSQKDQKNPCLEGELSDDFVDVLNNIIKLLIGDDPLVVISNFKALVQSNFCSYRFKSFKEIIIESKPIINVKSQHLKAKGYYMIGDFKKSLKKLEECREIYRKKEEIANLVKITEEISDIRFILLDFENASNGYIDCLDQIVNYSGCEDHPGSALVLLKLGKVYLLQKDFSKAKESIEKAYSILRMFKTRDNSNFKECLFSLGIVYKELSMNEKALTCFQELFNFYQRDKTLNIGHLALEITKNLSEILMNMQHNDEAVNLMESILSNSVKIYSSGFYASPNKLFHIYHNLGLHIFFFL